MKERLAGSLCALVFVSVLLFFSYLFQPVCNKCDSSPTVDRQSPSNGRPTMRLAASINMVCVEKEACGELPRDGRTKRWHFVWNSMDTNAQRE